MDTTSIARALREVSQYLQLKGDDFYKSRAYDLAADRIELGRGLARFRGGHAD